MSSIMKSSAPALLVVAPDTQNVNNRHSKFETVLHTNWRAVSFNLHDSIA